MKKISKAIILLIVTLSSFTASAQTTILDPVNSVYTIAYLKSYRADLIEKAMGCGLNIMYSSYTHPDGIRDSASIMVNPYLYGGARCQAKQMYLKIFGYAQNYQALQSAMSVAQGVKRAQAGKYRSIVIDWKNNDLQKSVQFLNEFSNQMAPTGIQILLKVPASYICKQVHGQFFINRISNIRKVIVEMYGQDPKAYKTAEQMFLSETNQNPTGEYPESRCPKFPSYVQLTRVANQIEFFIEKTLHQEEDGFVSQETLKKYLASTNGLYNKKMFYDGYPLNVIRL